MVKPKAYSYVRFSTPEQERGDSRRRQDQGAADYAKKRGLDLDDTLTFQDLGVSAFRGANAETGRLGEFLEAARKGLVPKGSYLLVESLDRISRLTARKAVRILENIIEEGITVVTLSDGREYTEQEMDRDPMSFIMSVLIFARANEESVTKGKRIKEVWKAKRAVAEEKTMTAKCPGWLKLDRARGKFVPIPERVAVVRRIFRDALRGVGQNSIAKDLNQEKIPVFGSGKHWHRSYVAKLLSNPAVMGVLTPHTLEYRKQESGSDKGEIKRLREPVTAADGQVQRIDGYYPQIISEEMFFSAQALRAAGGNPRRGRHATGELRNIFGGLLVCPTCGATATRVYKGKPPKGGEYLVCSAAKTGAGKCKYSAHRYQPVEDALLREASYMLANIPAGQTTIDRDIEAAEAGLDALQSALGNLLRGLEHGRPATVTARIQELEQERETLQERLQELYQRQEEISGPLVKARAKELAAILKTTPLNRTTANALLRQLFSKIVLDHTHGLLTFQWRHGAETDVMFAFPE